MAVDFKRSVGKEKVIVFAGTYEESVCAHATDCQFEFISAATLPTVNSVTSQFDTTTNKWQLVIAGAGITDTSPATVDVLLGGVKQTTLSVDNASILVQVDSATTYTALPVQAFTVEGAPNGYNSLLIGAALEPKLIALSESTGSAYGTRFVATVIGAGVQDTLTLVNSADGQSICAT